MITARLAATLLLNVAFAVAALLVARQLVKRPGEGESRRARNMFALWWAGFAIDDLLNAATWLAGGLGLATPLVTSVLTYAAIVAIVAMSWGLTYYLLYLLTGKAKLFAPLAAFYAVSLVGLVALIAFLEPTGVRMGPWAGAITYVREPPAIAALWVAMYFLLPPLGGAIAYGLVAIKVRDRARRYRILAVSLGIFVWFSSALVLTGAGSTADAPAIAGRVIGVVCMLAILSAYFTPAWLARWLGDEDAPPRERPRLSAAQLQRRQESLERIRRLV